MNIEAILFSFLVPCLVFCGVYAAFSFHVARVIAGLLVALEVLASGALALQAARRKRAAETQPGSLWYTVLFVTSVLAVVLGTSFGTRNYNMNLVGYYELQHLNSYAKVDPARTSGAQVQDAGRVEFTRGSQISTSRAMSFTSSEVYCVAPIVGGSTPSSYDFWAVGMNCCSSKGGGDYRCGEHDNPNAHSGLRVMRESSLQYYRLAVQQAEATFQLHSQRPLFFSWTDDAAADENALWDDAVTFYRVGAVGYACLQGLLIAAAVVCLEKRELSLIHI